MSDERFDAKIDEVAREMTRGGLPPDFQARVIARLESGDERRWTWRPAWVLAPLAVAAAVLVAVLVVRAPWRSDGRVAEDVRSDAPQEVRSEVRLPVAGPVSLGPKPDPTYEGKPTSSRGSDLSRIASPERTSVIPSYVASGFSRTTDRPDATYGGGLASDLTPAPIEVESLDVEAMESMEVAPLSVDAMESIDVPRLDVAPLELPAIGEQ